MNILLLILRILLGIGLIFISGESSLACWRYLVKLSPLQSFIIVSALGLCALVFVWLPLYNKIFMAAEKWQKSQHLSKKKGLKKPLLKIARWMAKRHNYFEKHKNRKIVKRIRAYGLLGLFLGGFTPFLFHPALCAYKIFIRSRFGPLFIWLGEVARLAIEVFAGLKLIDLLAKLIS